MSLICLSQSYDIISTINISYAIATILPLKIHITRPSAFVRFISLLILSTQLEWWAIKSQIHQDVSLRMPSLTQLILHHLQPRLLQTGWILKHITKCQCRSSRIRPSLLDNLPILLWKRNQNQWCTPQCFGRCTRCPSRIGGQHERSGGGTWSVFSPSSEACGIIAYSIPRMLVKDWGECSRGLSYLVEGDWKGWGVVEWSGRREVYHSLSTFLFLSA